MIARLWHWLMAEQTARVSPRWIYEQERSEMARGIDGPTIQWPINRHRNECAWWNTRQLRREAEQMRRRA